MRHARTYRVVAGLGLASLVALGQAVQAQTSVGAATAPRAAAVSAPMVNTGGTVYYGSPASSSLYGASATTSTRATTGTRRATNATVGGQVRDHSKGWYFSPLAKPWLKPLR
jgi:hypothetical protein